MLIPKQAIPGSPEPKGGNPVEKGFGIMSGIAKAAEKLPVRKVKIKTVYGTYEVEHRGELRKRTVDNYRETIEAEGEKQGWARVDGTVADTTLRKGTPAQYEQAKKAVSQPAPKAKATTQQPRVNSSAQSKIDAYDQSRVEQDPTQEYTGGDARLARNGQGKGKTSTELRRMAPQEEGVNIGDETKRILKSIEDAVIGANPAVGAIQQFAKDKVSQIEQWNQRQATPDPFISMGAGMAGDALNPVSSFASATGNLYDPTATAEERLGAAGNVALYGLAAAGNLTAAKGAANSLKAFTESRNAGRIASAAKDAKSLPAPTRMDALGGSPASSFEEFRAGAKKAGDVSGIVPEFRQPIAKMPENRIDSLSPQGRALESWAGNNLQKLLDNGVGSDLRTWDAVGKHYGAGAVPRNAEDLPMWVNDLVHSVDQNDRTVSAMADLHGRGGDLHNDIVSMREAVGKTRGNMPGQTGVVAIVRQGRGYRAVQNSGWVPLEAVPMHLRRSVMDRVGSSETMFTSRANYQAWVDAGKPEGGVLRPRMADEYMLDSFGGNSTMDDFIMSPPKEAMVPRWAVRDELRNMTNQYQKAGEAAAAMRKPLKPQHFDEAVKHYNGDAVSTPVETAPAVKSVASRPASKPVAPKEEAKAAQDVATESGGDLVGYAKQISGNDPLPGVSRKQLLKDGEEAIATGKVNPDAFVDNVIKRGKGNGDESATVASLVELRRIRNRQMELEKLNTPEAADEWTKLQDRADKYVQAGDLIGNDWHRMGMALQVAIKQDMSIGSLESRAKLLNSGQDVSADVKSKLQKLSEDHAKALKEIEKLKSNNADVMDRIKTNRIEPRHAVRSREKARSVAADYFKGKNLAPDGGVGKNRQRGAVSYTITPEEARAKSAIRKLAKEIALDGAETLDDVLNGIRKEIGIDVKDDDLLAFIYEPYSKYRIEADVARIKSNQALADVQRAAEFRAKSGAAKAWGVFEGVFNNLTRTMSLGADLSAPMIQGRKGITANTRGWVSAYKPMLQVVTAPNAETAALEHLAKIESSRLYPKAKAAGLEITTPGGKFSQQEENFIGNMSQILEIAQNAKGATKAVKILQPYLSTMVRSEAGFTTFMNDLRWSTFERFSKLAPDDPQYLKDVAGFINVIYGRGTGKMAQAAGSFNLGRGLLAPRYLVSQLQFQGGVPLIAAKTPLAKAKIAGEYAKYIAAVSGLMYTAKVMGWDAPTDTRHTDFGKISNGKVTIDIASKDVQFWKLMMQNLYGKVNQVGGYADPSFENAAKVDAQFIQGKLAPLPKMVSEGVFGQFTDQGKRIPINEIPKQDHALRIAPIWVQDLVRDSSKWDDKSKQALFTVLGILGQDSKPKPIKDGGKPIRYTRPGIYSKG